MPAVPLFNLFIAKLKESTPIYFVEGVKHLYFGRTYCGAFLPSDVDPNSLYGLYFIAGTGKFYYRTEGKKGEETRLVSDGENAEFRLRLMDTIEQVISTKADVVFNPAETPAPKKKREVIKLPKPDVSLVASDRFMVLRGWDGNREKKNFEPKEKYNNPSGLKPGDVTFTYPSRPKP
jgi:hypothetical protein